MLLVLLSIYYLIRSATVALLELSANFCCALQIVFRYILGTHVSTIAVLLAGLPTMS